MDDLNLNTAHDPFDEISRLGAKAYQEGYAEGEISGKKAAFTQGFQIGKSTTFNVLYELGNYYGQCQMYQVEHRDEPENAVKINCIKLAAQICQLIDTYDFANCHSDQFALNLNHVRDKYKQFCSLTNSKNNFSKQVLSNASKFNF